MNYYTVLETTQISNQQNMNALQCSDIITYTVLHHNISLRMALDFRLSCSGFGPQYHCEDEARNF
jgi:hypothetical protein